jgi:hypothetical protein
MCANDRGSSRAGKVGQCRSRARLRSVAADLPIRATPVRMSNETGPRREGRCKANPRRNAAASLFKAQGGPRLGAVFGAPYWQERSPTSF